MWWLCRFSVISTFDLCAAGIPEFQGKTRDDLLMSVMKAKARCGSKKITDLPMGMRGLNFLNFPTIEDIEAR